MARIRSGDQSNGWQAVIFLNQPSTPPRARDLAAGVRRCSAWPGERLWEMSTTAEGSIASAMLGGGWAVKRRGSGRHRTPSTTQHQEARVFSRWGVDGLDLEGEDGMQGVRSTTGMPRGRNGSMKGANKAQSMLNQGLPWLISFQKKKKRGEEPCATCPIWLRPGGGDGPKTQPDLTQRRWPPKGQPNLPT